MIEDIWTSVGMDSFIINDFKAAFEKFNRKTKGHIEVHKILDTWLSTNVHLQDMT